ncbi:MAG: hypothetical protein JW984_09005 [Deltaproteobacteria bacterium]|uniref:Uncharacterized protein n=1 Tax=Candidatus Zymogenus saltonus TaxID=2844893 RepID=A0A9D8PPB8_9DELT|nr:hypothetical protein [Candidatus Zymogenus saltonus]
MAKRLFLSFLVLIGIALSALILFRLLRPEKPTYTITEVERVFPGGETIFVESRGLRDAWNLFKGSDYYRERGYASLLTLPVLDEFSREIGGVEGDIGRDISFDIVMYLMGLESAVGFYMDETDKERLDYLVVSRVYPEILFMERLATFFAGERYVTESKYRGLKVKEIVIDSDGEESRDIHKIVYTINGDLLILADKEELFYIAADRHLEGKRGGLCEDERFISARGKVDNLERPCIFGFVDSKEMRETPVASKVLSEIESNLSFDLLLFGARIDETGGDDLNAGEIVVELETRGGNNRGIGKSRAGFFSGGLPKPEITEDELVLVKVHDLSILPEGVFKGSFPSKGIMLSALSDLVFDGFAAAVVEGDGNCPGLVAWGKSPPGAIKVISKVSEKNGWAIIESKTGDPKFYSIVETGTLGPELLVFTFYNKMLFVGSSADTLKALIERMEEGRSVRLSLKEAILSKFRERERGITLTARPGPIWESMKTCPSAFKELSARLYPSSEDDMSVLKRFGFIEGLYPVGEVEARLFGVDKGIRAEITVRIDGNTKNER